VIKNLTSGQIIATEVQWCDTFLSRGRGLMFRRAIGEDEAFVFVESWLDAEKKVVDKKLARPFRPYYAPQRPAQYFVEGHPSILDKVQIGDRLGLEQ
jgi:uncharacterized membrane protein (UPF0127 family)